MADIVYKATGSGGNFNWEQINPPTTERLSTIGTITSDLYIAAGENGTIQTNHGGQTWQNVSAFPDPTLISIVYSLAFWYKNMAMDGSLETTEKYI